MKRVQSMILPGALCILFVMMVVWNKSVSAATYEGVDLCLRVVIPSLFPFFVICTYFNSALSQYNFTFLRVLGRFCRIPKGAECLLITGLLGGYPIGAQCISQSKANKEITLTQAERMLGFCSNAGPAFIFGMLSSQFPNINTLWPLWGIQIVTSVLIGHYLPSNEECIHSTKHVTKNISLSSALERSIKGIATVCGWVMLFKIISTSIMMYVNTTSALSQILILGALELVSGCAKLTTISSIGLRFIVASAFLSFGGICVQMQTISVTQGIRKRTYVVGKFLQTYLSVIIATIIQLIAFPPKWRYCPNVITLSVCVSVLSLIVIIFFRKSSRFSVPSVIQ